MTSESDDVVKLAHGAGGSVMEALLKRLFIGGFSRRKALDGVGLDALDDGASLRVGGKEVVVTMDGHTVEPLFFPGGDLGRLAISGADCEVVDQLLAGHRELVALIPGARWESKMWPAERFAKVADALSEQFGLTAVVTGAAGDAELAARIGAAARSPIVDLTGRTTLKQAAELLRRCRVTVGNDTGPLYLSSAVGTRTVGLFGPSDARRLGPYGDGHAKVVAEVDCAPCRNRTCRRRTCMESISPEQVIEAAANLLADGQGV